MIQKVGFFLSTMKKKNGGEKRKKMEGKNR